jgi:hypothetical protein
MQQVNPPDLETLRLIHTREALHRPHWPQDFDACMQDPLISRVLALLDTRPSVTPPSGIATHARPS